jgi:hypothetical protein
MEPLRPYRHRNSPEHPYVVRREELWELYALSRVNDYLLLAYQGSPLCTPKVPLATYVQFFRALGLGPFEEPVFSSFYHEIVEAEAAPPEDEAAEIGRVFWPGLRFGDLLFSRAGVRVRAPVRLIDPRTAPYSTLYFAHRRLRRATEDQSQGWGHNAQWRTAFRRDYEEAGQVYFNVDGSIDISGDVSGPERAGGPTRDDLNAVLPGAARRELLMHRCRVTGDGSGRDLWPYDDTLRLRKGEHWDAAGPTT